MQQIIICIFTLIMNRKHAYLFLLATLFCLFSMSSCKVIFPNYMLRENQSYFYYEIEELKKQELEIIPGDWISFTLTTQSGIQLIDMTTGTQTDGQNNMNMQQMLRGGGGAQYMVKPDGMVELPVIGDILVEGLTRTELEDLLEEKYSYLYNDPFVMVRMEDRRAYVFMGLEGAKVVPLINDNMTLIQVLAASGGVTRGSKSRNIRVIRGDYENPSIRKIDLSTIAGLKDADMIIQPNDLIIVAPTTPVAAELLKQVTPILGLLSSLLTIYLLITRRV